MSVAFLLLLPILWMVVVKFALKTTIDYKEAIAILMVGVVVTIGGWQAAKYSQAYDREFLNGYVTGKKQVRVSCEHSYDCNCRTVTTGTGENRRSRRECDTCYEHSNDWDWDVYTSLSKTITIDRIDRRGSQEPPRWSKVVVGESVAIEHSYLNYIKGARHTVLKDISVDVTGLSIPPYPTTFDYYRATRVLRVGTPFPRDVNVWADDLNDRLKTLGAQKHANAVVVFTSYPDSYRFALKQEWIGGKSNDTIVVIGVDKEGNYVWSDAFGWSRSSLIYVTIRNELMDLPSVLDHKAVLDVIQRNITKHYERRSTSEFEHLANDFNPGIGLTSFLALLIVLSLSVITYFAHKEDLFANIGRRRRY